MHTKAIFVGGTSETFKWGFLGCRMPLALLPHGFDGSSTADTASIQAKQKDDQKLPPKCMYTHVCVWKQGEGGRGRERERKRERGCSPSLTHSSHNLGPQKPTSKRNRACGHLRNACGCNSIQLLRIWVSHGLMSLRTGWPSAARDMRPKWSGPFRLPPSPTQCFVLRPRQGLHRSAQLHRTASVPCDTRLV